MISATHIFWFLAIFPALSVVFIGWALFTFKRAANDRESLLLKGGASDGTAVRSTDGYGASQAEPSGSNATGIEAIAFNVNNLSEKLTDLEKQINVNTRNLSDVSEKIDQMTVDIPKGHKEIVKTFNDTFYIASHIYNALSDMETTTRRGFGYHVQSNKNIPKFLTELGDKDPVAKVYGGQNVLSYGKKVKLNVESGETTSNTPVKS